MEINIPINSVQNIAYTVFKANEQVKLHCIDAIIILCLYAITYKLYKKYFK